tara:strand:- start:3809 stop:4312 length:504 start_codon:yes stop_codon:yes gene_type:complete
MVLGLIYSLIVPLIHYNYVWTFQVKQKLTLKNSNMKKTIKTVLLKDLKPTTELVNEIIKEKGGTGMEFQRELNKLITAGILLMGDESDVPKLSEEQLKDIELEGGSIFDVELEDLEDIMRVDGYLPKEHTYIRVFRENYVVDGCKRLFVLQKLFSGNYIVEVEELTL